MKSKGIFFLLKKYLIKEKSESVFVGLNMTAGVNLYTDKSPFTNQSYDYEGQSPKFDGYSCAYLKKGIWYGPRGTSCEARFEFFCLWTRKYFLN